ncbi:MAG: cyclic nucleotide-binding domain-containing protein [Deltaproteobacteria bacterium]|nr:cyclic nucleotide-binding domain-containing protein [Deltaproteobacteria bacterium]
MMDVSAKREILGRVEIFSRCKRGDLKTMARSCQEVTYQAGEALCRQGERGVAMFVIVAGKVRIVEDMPDGGSVLLGHLGPDAVVGEMAVVDGEERMATVIAEEPTSCLTLTSWDLKAAIRERPAIALDMLLTVVRRFRDTTADLRRMERASKTPA